MNKSELAHKVAEKTSLTVKEAEATTNSIFDIIEEALAAREKVQIMGFGTFEVRDRAARSGRNPQTGETIEIPATTLPAFKAGKELKEKVK